MALRTRIIRQELIYFAAKRHAHFLKVSATWAAHVALVESVAPRKVAGSTLENALPSMVGLRLGLVSALPLTEDMH